MYRTEQYYGSGWGDMSVYVVHSSAFLIVLLFALDVAKPEKETSMHTLSMIMIWSCAAPVTNFHRSRVFDTLLCKWPSSERSRSLRNNGYYPHSRATVPD